MRLIDADKAKAMLKPYEKSDESWMCTGGTAIRLIHNAIDNAPTVDAVPVVRCQDCRHYDNGYCTNPYGLKLPGTKSFCDCGRRRQMGMEELNDGTL